MTILYLANIRLPTEKAHGIQIMKTCESLAARGDLAVKLLLLGRRGFPPADPFAYYGIRRNFQIIYLPAFNFLRFGAWGFLIQSFLLGFFSLPYLFNNRTAIIFSRDWQVLYFLSFFTKKIIWEAHTPQNNFLVRRIVNRAKTIVTITHQLKQFYQNSFSLNREKIAVVPDAVDLAVFRINDSRIDCRWKFKLPTDKKIALYTGHLYRWKGVETLAAAAKYLPESVLIILVGGTSYDLEAFRAKHATNRRILILGQQPHQDIPFYLRAADLLILPNTAKDDVSRLYTSPMKLFEYLASGTPIIASDLPSLREILNENNAVFVTPDDPVKLAAGIEALLADQQKADRLSKQASLDALNYSWEKRAECLAVLFPSLPT